MQEKVDGNGAESQINGIMTVHPEKIHPETVRPETVHPHAVHP